LPFEFNNRGATSSGAAASGAMRPSVLVVDDEPGMRKLLERELGRCGFDPFLVSSAREARQVMDALVFPIAVIDRALEDADGMELIHELRLRYATHRIYIVLFSSLDSADELARGMRAGTDAYVSKSAFPERLIRELERGTEVARLTKR
jgi:DNA-binding response OmpR family regulator